MFDTLIYVFILCTPDLRTYTVHVVHIRYSSVFECVQLRLYTLEVRIHKE